jgi:hypothetical protein
MGSAPNRANVEVQTSVLRKRPPHVASWCVLPHLAYGVPLATTVISRDQLMNLVTSLGDLHGLGQDGGQAEKVGPLLFQGVELLEPGLGLLC